MRIFRLVSGAAGTNQLAIGNTNSSATFIASRIRAILPVTRSSESADCGIHRYITTAVVIRIASDIGISARHATPMSWSNRNRGKLQRVHMKMKITNNVFAKKTIARRMHASSDVVDWSVFRHDEKHGVDEPGTEQ